MKIGIIVKSYTGNTLSVAEKLKEQFIKSGHGVQLIQLENTINPNIKDLDLIIFGSSVRAFDISPDMRKYINQIETLKGKKIGCFVTQFFPFASLGGKQAIRQMKTLCEDKEGTVYATGIINWSSKRDRRIKEVVEELNQL